MLDVSTAPAMPLVRRRDAYRPPEWLVPQVALDFALDPATTRVRARLEVTRNGAHAEALRLDGGGQHPLAVWVDGVAVNDWAMEDDTLVIPLAGDAHVIETAVEIAPDRNTQLMGLYASGGNLCTQCEAEGFRRITFFPDRPDVLSVYRVRMSADRERFPILLANGDPIAHGSLDDGHHWAEWHDPFPKPSYLFALVAGDLAANRATFTTASGREVQLCDLGARGGPAAHHPRAPRAEARDGVGRARLWPRIRSRRVQHRRGRRLQLRRDGEQGAEHLQQPLHPRRSRYRDRLRLRRDRRRRRARIFPQLVGRPRHLPRLVPAFAEGRLHRLSRPGLLRRPGQRRGQADRGRTRTARGAVPGGCRPARAPGPTRLVPWRSATSTPRPSTTRAPS